MLRIHSLIPHSEDDWLIMQEAHAKASAMLGRSPFTHFEANRLARIVMKLFNEGNRDVENIATMAATRERSYSGIRINPAQD